MKTKLFRSVAVVLISFGLIETTDAHGAEARMDNFYHDGDRRHEVVEYRYNRYHCEKIAPIRCERRFIPGHFEFGRCGIRVWIPGHYC